MEPKNTALEIKERYKQDIISCNRVYYMMSGVAYGVLAMCELFMYGGGSTMTLDMQSAKARSWIVIIAALLLILAELYLKIKLVHADNDIRGHWIGTNPELYHTCKRMSDLYLAMHINFVLISACATIFSFMSIGLVGFTATQASILSTIKTSMLSEILCIMQLLVSVSAITLLTARAKKDTPIKTI